MDEFIERCSRFISKHAQMFLKSLNHTLRLLEHLHVFRILTRHALQKSVHVETVYQARLLLVCSGRGQESSVGVEQTCKASDKRRSDLFWLECRGTREANLLCTTPMGTQSAA